MHHNFLQRIFFFFYSLAWALAKPLLKKHKRLREGYAERMVDGTWLDLKEKGPVSLWIQAASGGEAYLTLALLKYIPKAHARCHILCTSMTKQGIEVLQRGREAFETAWHEKYTEKCPVISICYFPFDDKKSMQKAFLLARPKVCILLETELWPNFMCLCRENKSLLYVVNARMTEKTYKAYQKIKGIFAGINPDKIFATREQDKACYQEIFPQSACAFMHNIKFDTVYQELTLAMGEVQAKKKNFLQKVFAPKTCVYLFASVRKEEEQELLPVIEKLHAAKTKSIICIAPRHAARFMEWKKALQAKGLAVYFAAELFEKNTQVQAQDILVWDRFGDLKELYALADYVFVGGSLVPLGGQNFLEALVYGIIPHTGIYLYNFLWAFEMQDNTKNSKAKNLAEENLLCLHSSAHMLTETFLALPEEKFTQHAKIQERFKTWLKPLIGDTKKIMEEILETVQP